MKSCVYKFGSIFLFVIFAACGRDTHPPQEGQGPQHGTPEGWTFALPRGDAAAGKELFAELQCYSCHEVKGETFPAPEPGEETVGPELSQMAGMHSLEFFAESIVNPNAVIDGDAKERGYLGPDGRSKMPDFADVLTVKQLADLATYLNSLGGGGHKH